MSQITFKRITTSDNNTYIGLVHGEKRREGVGQMELEDNSKISAIYKYDRLTGLVYMEKQEGDIFFGDYKDNKKNGVGVNLYQGCLFVGYFKDNETNGFGIKKQLNLQIESTFDSKGLYSGFSRVVYPNQNITYTGNFVENEISGFGLLTGDVNYTGEYKAGNEHGRGIKVF